MLASCGSKRTRLRGCIALLAVAGLQASSMVGGASANDKAAPKPTPPKIQVAVLLDTSNSMDGLIEQAKSQLWKIVNEFATCKRGGMRPDIEVALYEYGKQTLSAPENFVRQILPLTTDLDKVSEQLFALRTNGGEEYCGAVIERATNELKWSNHPKDLKVIVIAGNEPFSQGPVDYRKACRNAIQKGIVVNTIHCGNHQPGEAAGWRDGALLADGNYTQIDQNKALAAIVAPQDKAIVELGIALNSTYVAYGTAGATGTWRQTEQDKNSIGAAAKDAAVQRQMYKCSSNYVCDSWDLVDAVKTGKVKLADMKAKDLPKEMQKMTPAECKAFLDKKAAERSALQAKIAGLNVERQRFVDAEAKKLAGANAASLDSAVIAGVRKQAIGKDFVFDKK